MSSVAKSAREPDAGMRIAEIKDLIKVTDVAFGAGKPQR
jgi:hypothetical protein